MKKRKCMTKIGWTAAACAAALAILFGGMKKLSAYFTDTDQSVNTFTVGKVEIEHHEDHWTPDPQDITPNQEFDKDPAVENTGDHSAFVFQIVKVPCANVITADVMTGEKQNSGKAARTDLFSYAVNDGWYLMEDAYVGEEGQEFHEYTYVYGTASKCTKLEAGETTPTLFDRVRFANVIEGQGLEENSYSIIIDCCAIQTNDVAGSDDDNTSTVNPYDILEIIRSQAE